MYALQVGHLLTNFPDGVADNLPKIDFKVVVESRDGSPVEGYDHDIRFPNLWDALSAALSAAGDLRDFEVFVGLDCSSDEHQYVTIKHAAVVRGLDGKKK